MKLDIALPEFCEELRSLFLRLERSDLASQLQGLSIAQRCRCTNPGCASFQVSGGHSPDAFEMAEPRRSTFTGSLDLNADRGNITVRLDQLGRITAFEVLNRPDVRRKVLGSR